MSKFKVGDKVALNNSPKVLLGQVMCEAFGGYYIKTEKNYYTIMSEDDLVLYEGNALSDDEIYDMLKPKMEKSNVWSHGYRVAAYNDGYHLVREENDVIKAIALAYRSGYLRAKKGRPFKIGGEKD